MATSDADSSARHRSCAGTTARPAIAIGPPLGASGPATLTESLIAAASTDRVITLIDEHGATSTLSYAALLDGASRLAAGLRGRLPKPGQIVLLQLNRLGDFLTAFWACLLAGHIPAPTSFAQQQIRRGFQRLAAAWSLLDCPALIGRRSLVAVLRREVAEFQSLNAISFEDVETARSPAEPAPCDPLDQALVLFTSGSTSGVKAVALTHRNLVSMAAATACQQGFDEREVTLNWLPLDHVGAISFLHVMPTWLGCSQTHAATSYILADVVRWLDLASSRQATISWAPNFAFRLLAEQAARVRDGHWDLSRLRFLVNAGELVIPETLRGVWSLLAPHGLSPRAIRPAFGMSETCSGITWSDRIDMQSSDDDQLRELGPPIPGAALRIVDAEGKTVGEGVVGELQLCGPSVTSGYLADADANRTAFTGGWFRTGDLGFLRDGRLILVGRQKEILIVRGVHYSAGEIESVVDGVPGVQSTFSTACAIRDEAADEDELLLFAVPQSGAGAGELIERIRRAIARSFGLAPREIVLIRPEEVPKTSIGKIQRAALLEKYRSGALRGHSAGALARSIFFEVDWRHVSLNRAAPQSPRGLSGPWLLLGDDALARRLAEHIAARGGRPWRFIDPGRANADVSQPLVFDALWAPQSQLPLDQAIGDGKDEGWIHILDSRSCSTAALARGAAELQSRLPRQLALLAQIVQTVKRHSPQARVRLVTLTRGAQVLPEDPPPVDLAGAARLGYLRSLAAEDSQFQFLGIDLDPALRADDLDLVLDELLFETTTSEVAYRNGRRFLPRLIPARLSQGEGLVVRADGTYVITGATGGLGQIVAQWLMDRGARHLLLVARGAPPQATTAHFAQAASRASAHFLAADVATREGVEAIAGRLHGLPPLAAVFHLAGLPDDAPVAGHSFDHIQSVLAPKAIGALWLRDQLIREFPAPLILFSSMVGPLGAPRQAAYGAASALLDALAQDLRKQGAPALAIDWGPWSVAGMATRSTSFTIASLQSAGIHPFDQNEGRGTLDQLVSTKAPARVLALSVDWPRFAATRWLPAGLIDELLGTEAAESRQPALDPAHLKRESAVERERLCRAYVVAQLEELLGRRLNEAELGHSFPELGIDSVTSAAFVARLRAVMDHAPDGDLLIQYPCADALAVYLSDSLS